MNASVKIYLSDQITNPYGNLEPREKFWAPIIQLNGRNTTFESASNCEAYMQTNFAFDLKDEIVRDSASMLESKERYSKTFDKKVQKAIYEKHDLATDLFFKVSNIHYASLGFDLLIEPAGKILKLCDDNFEYLKIFLEGFISETFKNAFDLDRGLPFDVSVSLDEVSKYPKMWAPEMTAEKTDKAKFAWLVANGSLLVPFLISIFLFWSYQSKLENIQSIHDKKIQQILENEEKIMKQAEDNLTRAEQVQKEIIESFLKEKAKDKTDIK